MKLTSPIPELATGLITLVIMVGLLNPFNLLMPSQSQMMLLLALLVVFSLFTHFFWKENSGDEREQLHRYIVNRYAYLAGCVVLISGIVVQSIQHNLDPWLVFAIGTMILAKIVGSVIAERTS